MVDLKGQYDFIKNEVDHAIAEVIKNTTFINGPAVHEFQSNLEAYLKVKHVIPCANGTDALQIALMSLPLEPGDEVITADFTFAATVEVITLLKLKPVLVDIDPKTFNINTTAVQNAITPKTKVIIPVHLFGQCAPMESLLEIANQHHLYILEDNAQALGATYTFSNGNKAKTGTMGHLGATSFFPSKNLGAFGDGGAIFTNDDDLAHTIRGIVNHGMYQRYYHDVVGVNSRLDAIQAAILKVKLKYLDFYNERRKEAALFYDKKFNHCKALTTPYRSGSCDSHVFHQYTLRVLNGSRDALMHHLNSHGIPCAVYYPVPLHKQKAYADPQIDDASFPVTNQLVNEVISLPMHTELNSEQLEFITQEVIAFVNGF